MEQTADVDSVDVMNSVTYSVAEKTKIDKWLESNNYNQYGDDPETVYIGGTPLFNESTGKKTNRYTYLINKFPEKPWN